MERYRFTLNTLYTSQEFQSSLETGVANQHLMFSSEFGQSAIASLISMAIYNHFYDDLVIYDTDENSTSGKNEVKEVFMKRLSYDVAVKFPYWRTKYNYIMKLFDEDEIVSLMQSSKMTSSSSEVVDTAGGVLQKTATTPTGVSSGTSSDSIDISMDSDEGSLDTDVSTEGFVDKYTNYQGKTATTGKQSGTRSGTILREGSIDELLKILEKLPASFTDEICREVVKHFEFVYEY